MKRINFIFLGMLAGVLAIILETLFSIIFSDILGFDFSSWSYLSMSVTVFVEEFLLFLSVGKIFHDSPFPKESLPSTIFIGIGFAVLEILFNSFTHFKFSDLPAYIGLTFIHILTPLFYLFFFLKEKTFARALILLFLGCALHFIYNFSVWKEIDFWLINAIFLVLISVLTLFFLTNKSFLPNDKT